MKEITKNMLLVKQYVYYNNNEHQIPIRHHYDIYICTVTQVTYLHRSTSVVGRRRPSLKASLKNLADQSLPILYVAIAEEGEEKL